MENGLRAPEQVSVTTFVTILYCIYTFI